MDEVFPVLAGVVVGIVTHRVRSVRLHAVLVAVLGFACGTMASWISGELAVSWSYLLIDIAQVIAASIMTTVLIGVWRRRHARSLAR